MLRFEICGQYMSTVGKNATLESSIDDIGLQFSSPMLIYRVISSSMQLTANIPAAVE
jgi:hypothetical protein